MAPPQAGQVPVIPDFGVARISFTSANCMYVSVRAGARSSVSASNELSPVDRQHSAADAGAVLFIFGF